MDSARAAILDLDGTLIDSHGDHIRAWKMAFARHGIRISDGDISSRFGKTSLEIAREIAEERGTVGLGGDEIDRMASEKNDAYGRIARITLLPGAVGFLRLLRDRGIAIGIASASTRENVEAALGEFIGPGAFVSSEDVKNGKPDPEIYLKAAEKLGFRPSECIAVDDSILGVRAAIAAGIRCIGVGTGEVPAAELAKEATWAFKGLGEAMGRMDEILSG